MMEKIYSNGFVFVACIVAGAAIVVKALIQLRKRRERTKDVPDEEVEVLKVACPECGNETDIDAVKCENCGALIEQQYDFKECRNCKEIYDVKFSKCPYCTVQGRLEAAADPDWEGVDEEVSEVSSESEES